MLDIAEVLRANAHFTRDGSMYWCHPSRPSPSLHPVLLGPHLYAGATGIALFFAAISSVCGGDGFRDISLRAIAPLRADIRKISADPDRAQRLQQPIGGLVGLGSIIYALVRIGDLLGDSSIVDDAHLAATMLIPDRIAADEKLDVMIGSAGAVLALLALDERRPEKVRSAEPPLELALHCARRLLQRDGWATAKGLAADGFCHGRAGICTALVKLYERTGRQQFWRVLQRLLVSDHAPSSSLQRYQTALLNNHFRHSWCKGAAGIALGHMALIKIHSHSRMPEEAISLLEIAGAPTLSETDDLCCGSCGRVDVLIYAATMLQEPAYLERAASLVSRVLERAQHQGRYSLKLGQDAGVDLRLFPGIAGIGYSLVRLLAADSIPCVVAME
jgi:lantibiotic modifying enzyme